MPEQIIRTIPRLMFKFACIQYYLHPAGRVSLNISKHRQMASFFWSSKDTNWHPMPRFVLQTTLVLNLMVFFSVGSLILMVIICPTSILFNTCVSIKIPPKLISVTFWMPSMPRTLALQCNSSLGSFLFSFLTIFFSLRRSTISLPIDTVVYWYAFPFQLLEHQHVFAHL